MTVQEAERRQLTVLFCDLVGSTQLSAQLDPEDLREIVHEYQSICAGVVERLNGHIAQFLGDGVLIYFGYPLAHEDDPRRAVRAALEIQEEAHQLGQRLAQERRITFAVRQGIHTGPVVVGGVGVGEQREQLAIGETPNVAARVQSLAAPDTVLVSEATERLVRGFFRCEGLGAQVVRGIAEPVSLYRVLAPSGAESRIDVAAAVGLTPFVGREQETRLLLERWERARDGNGQAVLLHGEPGIGKSRQVRNLKDQVAGAASTVLECRCSPYYQNSALYPVIDLLERELELGQGQSQQIRLSTLEESLQRYGFDLRETVPLFASLLSVPVGATYPPLDLTPQALRQRTMESMIEWLFRVAARRPTLLIMEDLHWIDPSTLDFLNLVIDRVPDNPILMVLTFRPEFQPPWSKPPYLLDLVLPRLPADYAETMITSVAGAKPLPPEVMRQVVSNTDGVPLFVEELTKTVLESGLVRETADRYELSGPLPALAIPMTLQDSLNARLDRLDTTKSLAQLGAVLGREFRYELMQAVAPVDERTLRRELARLVRAELLFQEGTPPAATYRFKHALIQDTAYQSLLRRTRARYHREIAEALVERFPEIVETQPEVLAHHYTEAGLAQQAIPRWLMAGQRAIERSANAEAIGHLSKGLELLAALSESTERSQLELAFQANLGTALIMTRGYAAPEVEEAFGRAEALSGEFGESTQTWPIVAGLWNFSIASGRYRAAHNLAQRMLTIARHEQDSGLLVASLINYGVSFFWGGPYDLSAAGPPIEEGAALYDAELHRPLALLNGQDPQAAGLAHLSWIVWLQGYPERALQELERGLNRAYERGHAFSLAEALVFAAVLYRLRGEVQPAKSFAEAGIALAKEQVFPFWLASGSTIHGWALAQEGQGEEGLSELRASVAMWVGTGARIWRTHQLGIFAEVLGATGNVEEGLAVLDEALSEVESTEEEHFEAELHRLKGDLFLRRNKPDLAEASFLRSLDVARHQRAKSWELRTAMSLARLWQTQGQRQEARRMVTDVYGWFTEGFDSPDLRDAIRLINQLSG